MSGPNDTITFERQSRSRSRLLEDVSFVLGVLVAVSFAAAEIALKLGVHLGECSHTDSGTPWGLLVIAGILIAPKTLGRATAGKVWQAVGERIAGRRLPDPPEGGSA